MVAPQLVGQHTGEGVAYRLRDAVGRRAAARLGKRARLARHVHDSPMGTAPQQREERRGDAPGAEQISVQGLLHRG